MQAHVFGLAVLAIEEFVPPTDWRAQIALPAGIVIFLGSVFLLLRSNLGTRRAYLVEASSFFGFMVVLSLFWAFGAPGTPQFTGPQNLPGQAPDYYLPKWVPFVQDSLLADERFTDVRAFPEGFQELGISPEEAAAGAGGEEGAAGAVGGGEGEPVGDTGLTADQFTLGADELRAYLAEPPPEFGDREDLVEAWEETVPVGDDWIYVIDDVPQIRYAMINGFPVMGVTYTEPSAENPLEPAPDGETYTGFAFFDAGFPLLPSLVMIVLSLAGFALHSALLAWDENRERRARERERAEEPERVPATA